MERILFVFIAALMASSWAPAENTDSVSAAPSQFNEATVADLQAKMKAGTLTSEQLTQYYLRRILDLDQSGPGVNAVIELNPDAIKIAQQMDELRRHGKILGPMHGIPVLIKDNIDTGDRMQTSAGSLALVGRPAVTDSTVAANLRAGGAVISARLTCPNGRTSAPLNPSAAGPAVADRRIIHTASIAIPAIPTDYTQFLNPKGLQGARLGLTRAGLTGFDPDFPTPQPVLDAFEAAVDALTAAGATVVDLDAAGFTFPSGGGESLVLDFDFRGDVQAYFATRVGVPVAGGTLQTAINFNNAHADEEMPFFNQDVFDQAESLAPGPDDPQPVFGGMTYNQALEIDRLSGVNGIDAALKLFSLDAVVTATDNPAWATDLLYGDHFLYGTSGLAAPPGYPIVQVPAGIAFGVPLGISFFGTAFSEPTLIKLASGFEAATEIRAKNLPTFAPMTPSDNIQGTTLRKPRKAAPAVPAPDAGKKKAHHL
jgi:hypothetical protein